MEQYICICGHECTTHNTLIRHQRTCISFQLTNISKELFITKYIQYGLNIEELIIEFNIPYKIVRYLINHFNLNKLTPEQSKERHLSIRLKNPKFKELYLKYQSILDMVTKEFLLHHYIEEEKSMGMIVNEFGISVNDLRLKFIEHNIKKRTNREENLTKHTIAHKKKTSLEKYGVEFHSQSDIVRNKQKKTMLERYGVEYPLQNKEIMEKSKQTCLNNNGVIYPMQSEELKLKQKLSVYDTYGVDNVFQLTKIKEKSKHTKKEKYGDENYSNIEKVKDTLFERYGITNPMQSQEFIDKIQSTKFKNGKQNGYASKNSQELFFSIYEKLENKEHIYFSELNKEFGKYDTINNRYMYYDFVDTIHKKVIEFNGDYYHCNPEIYNEAFVNSNTQQMAKDVWEFDNSKNKFITDLGFELLIVWESEYNKNKEETINKCLKYLEFTK